MHICVDENQAMFSLNQTAKNSKSSFAMKRAKENNKKQKPCGQAKASKRHSSTTNFPCVSVSLMRRLERCVCNERHVVRLAGKEITDGAWKRGAIGIVAVAVAVVAVLSTLVGASTISTCESQPISKEQVANQH